MSARAQPRCPGGQCQIVDTQEGPLDLLIRVPGIGTTPSSAWTLGHRRASSIGRGGDRDSLVRAHRCLFWRDAVQKNSTLGYQCHLDLLPVVRRAEIHTEKNGQQGTFAVAQSILVGDHLPARVISPIVPRVGPIILRELRTSLHSSSETAWLGFCNSSSGSSYRCHYGVRSTIQSTMFALECQTPLPCTGQFFLRQF